MTPEEYTTWKDAKDKAKAENRALREAKELTQEDRIKALFESNLPMTITDLLRHFYPGIDSRFRRRNELKEMKYKKYLESPEWREFRERILKRDGRCVKCEGTEHLSVHHLTYARSRNESPSDVQTLCSGCHKKHHDSEEKEVTLKPSPEDLGILPRDEIKPYWIIRVGGRKPWKVRPNPRG